MRSGAARWQLRRSNPGARSALERYESKGDVRDALAIQARAFATATRLGDPIVLAHVPVALATELSLVGDEASAKQVLGDSVDRLPPDDSYLPYALPST